MSGFGVTAKGSPSGFVWTRVIATFIGDRDVVFLCHGTRIDARSPGISVVIVLVHRLQRARA